MEHSKLAVCRHFDDGVIVLFYIISPSRTQVSFIFLSHFSRLALAATLDLSRVKSSLTYTLPAGEGTGVATAPAADTGCVVAPAGVIPKTAASLFFRLLCAFVMRLVI